MRIGFGWSALALMALSACDKTPAVETTALPPKPAVEAKAEAATGEILMGEERLKVSVALTMPEGMNLKVRCPILKDRAEKAAVEAERNYEAAKEANERAKSDEVKRIEAATKEAMAKMGNFEEQKPQLPQRIELCFDETQRNARESVTSIRVENWMNMPVVWRYAIAEAEGTHFFVEAPNNIIQSLDLAHAVRREGELRGNEIRVIKEDKANADALVAELQRLFPKAKVEVVDMLALRPKVEGKVAPLEGDPHHGHHHGHDHHGHGHHHGHDHHGHAH